METQETVQLPLESPRVVSRREKPLPQTASYMDRGWRYVPACRTDVRKTIAAYRKKMEAA